MKLFLFIIGLSVINSSAAQACPICGGGHPDLEQQVNEVKELAILWLADQQNIDGSWPSVNTQNAILGLQLADPSWLADRVLGERLLTTSRLEYELMQYLLPWRTSRAPLAEFEPSAGRLGQYMLAMKSICVPVDDFYGNNLQIIMNRLLRRKDFFTNFFAYSFSILSLCSCNASIYRSSLVKLAVGSERSDPCASQFGDDPGHSIDILSLQVMAMVCARDQAIERRIAHWDDILAYRVQCIIEGQNDDGTFGNDITTALAVQALTAADASQSSWNCVAAVEFLLSQQTDGDFGGVGATAQIIPFLNCNNFGSIREIEVTCPSEDSLPVPPVIVPGSDIVTFNIEVRVEDYVENYTVTILDIENLYFGMIRLADLNSDFTFETSDSAFGQSLDVINGFSDDASDNRFWTIHIGEEGTFAPAGIEGLFPSEGETYIFILTKFR